MNEERKNEILKLFDENQLLMTNHMTPKEHYQGLLDFQDFVGTLMNPVSEKEHYYTNDLIYQIREEVQKRGLDQYSIPISRGLSALKRLNNEIAVTVSGAKAERYVAKTLKYVSRPDCKLYSNVYVANDHGESEIDVVVLTSTGLMLLEIKSVTGDVEIDQNGRLLHSGVTCHDKIPVVQNMRKKQELLYDCLQRKMNELDTYIPLYISTYIVFCSENNLRIKVKNPIKSQKWCHRSQLVDTVNNFIGTRSYNDTDMQQLDAMLTELASYEKAFDYHEDYQALKEDIAGLLAFLYADSETTESTMTPEISEIEISSSDLFDKNTPTKINKKVTLTQKGDSIHGVHTTINAICHEKPMKTGASSKPANNKTKLTVAIISGLALVAGTASTVAYNYFKSSKR